MSKEKRGSRRIPIDCPAKIISSAQTPHYGRCRDLSINGMLLETDYVPRPGELMEVFIMPPPGPMAPLHAQVQVTRCTKLPEQDLFEIGAEIMFIIK